MMKDLFDFPFLSLNCSSLVLLRFIETDSGSCLTNVFVVELLPLPTRTNHQSLSVMILDPRMEFTFPLLLPFIRVEYKREQQ